MTSKKSREGSSCLNCCGGDNWESGQSAGKHFHTRPSENVNNLFYLNKDVNICFGSHCVSSRVCWETLQDCGTLDQSTSTVDVWVDWCVLQVDFKWISSGFQVDWFVLQVDFNQQQHFRTLGPCWTFCWTMKISVNRSNMSLRLNLWSTPHTCRLRVSRFFRAELSPPATMLTCFRAPEVEKFCKTTFPDNAVQPCSIRIDKNVHNDILIFWHFNNFTASNSTQTTHAKPFWVIDSFNIYLYTFIPLWSSSNF